MPGRLARLVPGEVVVDLPRAEDEPPHLGLIGCRIVEHRPETALREVDERRGGLLQPQEPLRRHHDQRPRGGVEGLAADQVEVLGRRGRVRNPDVLLGGELQEALETGARVLGTVPLVAVREQQCQP